MIRSSGISGFGYSVTGGLDLDDNGYAGRTTVSIHMLNTYCNPGNFRIKNISYDNNSM